MIEPVRTLLSITLLSCVFASINKSPNSDNVNYWTQYNEKRLNRLVNQVPLGHSRARNIIIFIGDGMGIQTVTAGRILKGQLNSRSGEEAELSWEDFPNTGLVKTYSVNRQVTDSAASGTAMFCGTKTNTGWIGLDCDGKGVESFMAAAQRAGKRTGFVTTTRVTHATPAALYAHTQYRDFEGDSYKPDVHKGGVDTARQLVESSPGKDFDVVLGGGRASLGDYDYEPSAMPNELDIKDDFLIEPRLDGRNLTQEWLGGKVKAGKRVSYVRNKNELKAINAKEVDSLLGLFANDHVAYDALRNYTDNPSLTDMVTKAIEVLDNGDKGFVLMVESGRIDLAHHQNMAKLALYETVALDRAVDAALNLTGDDTLIILASDHSHAMTFNGYPARGNDVTGLASDKRNLETLTYANGPGHHHHFIESKDATERKPLKEMDRSSMTYRHFSPMYLEYETHGGEDVAIYAQGPGSELVRGTMEQSFINYIVGFAGCFGAAARLNPSCNEFEDVQPL